MFHSVVLKITLVLASLPTVAAKVCRPSSMSACFCLRDCCYCEVRELYNYNLNLLSLSLIKIVFECNLHIRVNGISYHFEGGLVINHYEGG